MTIDFEAATARMREISQKRIAAAVSFSDNVDRLFQDIRTWLSDFVRWGMLAFHLDANATKLEVVIGHWSLTITPKQQGKLIIFCSGSRPRPGFLDTNGAWHFQGPYNTLHKVDSKERFFNYVLECLEFR